MAPLNKDEKDCTHLCCYFRHVTCVGSLHVDEDKDQSSYLALVSAALLTCGNKGLSSRLNFRQSMMSLFMDLGEVLYSLLRSGDKYPRPTIKMI